MPALPRHPPRALRPGAGLPRGRHGRERKAGLDARRTRRAQPEGGRGKLDDDRRALRADLPRPHAGGTSGGLYLRHALAIGLRRRACRLRPLGAAGAARPRPHPARRGMALRAGDAGAAGVRCGARLRFRQDRPRPGWRRLRDEPARACLAGLSPRAPDARGIRDSPLP